MVKNLMVIFGKFEIFFLKKYFGNFRIFADKCAMKVFFDFGIFCESFCVSGRFLEFWTFCRVQDSFFDIKVWNFESKKHCLRRS